MNKLLQKLKENDYIIKVSAHKAALIFSGLIAVANLLFYFVLTPRWVSGSSQFGPSPQMVPNLLTIGMFICAVVVFVTELRAVLKMKKDKAAAEEKAKTAAEKKSKAQMKETAAAESEPKSDTVADESAAAKTEEEACEDVEENFFEELLEAAKSDSVTLDLRGVVYILAVAASALFYVFCSDYLGFILTIGIIMVGLMLLYGVRKPLTIIITTLVMSVGIYFAFTKLLGLVLPVGVPLPMIAKLFTGWFRA
ncbi:MAG: tripartite tricarboxylate transporter TctB family protein [Clostridiales bacterium]|nr:tripartite tricarboxylate transporter TctB family protein [Clostridiales bacterium]